MRNASKKLISYPYSKENTIPDFVNNAVTNLIILILSDGKKFYPSKSEKKYSFLFKTSSNYEK